MRSPRAQDDSRLFSLDDTTEVKSYIAVPVDFDNEIVGVLEARFKIANAFADDDVGACELIAALVKDLIAEAGHAQVEADPAAPPVSVKPVYFSQMKVTAPQVSSQEMSAEGSSPAPVLEALPACTANEIVLAAEASGQISAERNFCRGCHQPLAEEELFCGKCGTEKIINPDGPLQSKWASLWFMNQSDKTGSSRGPGRRKGRGNSRARGIGGVAIRGHCGRSYQCSGCNGVKASAYRGVAS
jgi:hypothetical protein